MFFTAYNIVCFTSFSNPCNDNVPLAAMVDNLICKTITWEDEKKKLFLYDGVSFLVCYSSYFENCENQLFRMNIVNNKLLSMNCNFISC